MKKRTPAGMPGTALGVRQGAQIGLIVLVLTALLALTIWNASRLRLMLEAITMDYVEDMNVQLADDIAVRLHTQRLELWLLADSAGRLDTEEALADFLNAKAEETSFDSLVYLDREGRCLPAGWSEEDIPGLSTVREALGGEAQVTYVEGRSVVYAVPVHDGEAITGVLVGISGREQLQALIQAQGFLGQALTCIVSPDGEVVVAATDAKPFLQLETIFQRGGDGQAIESVRQMEEDMRRGQSGIFRFPSVDGSQLLLCYRPLKVNGWMLLTLVPDNLLSARADGYILHTYVIVGGIVGAFALLLVLLIRFYGAHKRQLERIAFVDPVTGGRSNASFQAAYRQLVPQAPPGTYTVVLLNVKGFKLINERFGTAAGDGVLRHIHQALQRHVDREELLARGEADNFFLCLHDHDHEVLCTRLEHMWEEVNTWSQGRDIPYRLTVLEGLFVVDDPAMEVTLVQDRARTACQHARMGEGITRVFYDAGLTRRLQAEQEIQGLFDSALEQHQFQLYLQPKVRLSDGAVAGAEALVRWCHPQRGLVPPDAFIPLLERSGKIVELDAYMFRQACALLRRWREEGRPLIPISVNLSRQHFKSPDFLEAFARTADGYRIPPGSLEFELTESLFFDKEQIAAVRQSIHQMHTLGFTCSLDDFGAGFSSLGLLKDFPVDVIKLDRQFFLDISNERSRDVIGCLVALAEKLHVHTVAEGIETEEQLDYLRQIHCDMVQGYFFSKPLPVAEFEAWCGWGAPSGPNSAGADI